MSTTGMSTEEFINYGQTGGNKLKYLRKWRKSSPAKITIWVHTGTGFHARWGHNWPRMVTSQEEGSNKKTLEIKPGMWICHESEEILKGQFFRDKNTKQRKNPPHVCPLCKMLEWVWQEIYKGNLNWIQPVFSFCGTDGKKKILTAGGICNMFSNPNLTEEQNTELKNAGIYKTEVYQQNAISKCQYIFAVVDNDNIEEGVQITTEAKALGEEMKRAIRDTIDQISVKQRIDRQQAIHLANPLRNPYAFIWEFKEKETISKMYRVVALQGMQMTEEIENLIVHTEPPDLNQYMVPGNVNHLRADMESACLIDMPFDRFFNAPELKMGNEYKDIMDEIASGVKIKQVKPTFTPPVDEDDFPPSYSETPFDKEELYVCDHCNFDGMKKSDLTCSQCGTTYNKNGQMVTRPCPECKNQVHVGDGLKTNCGACKMAIDTETWVAIPTRTRSTNRLPWGESK
jgi:hypothetical protein